jgi:hypothetical protein
VLHVATTSAVSADSRLRSAQKPLPARGRARRRSAGGSILLAAMLCLQRCSRRRGVPAAAVDCECAGPRSGRAGGRGMPASRLSFRRVRLAVLPAHFSACCARKQRCCVECPLMHTAPPPALGQQMPAGQGRTAAGVDSRRQPSGGAPTRHEQCLPRHCCLPDHSNCSPR